MAARGVDKKCPHPVLKVRTERQPCSCKIIKCYACSYAVRFNCKGHGKGYTVENPGRW